MGILAGYQFAPKPAKKVFALGGPLLLHVIIPTIDTLIGQDANNPSNEDVKRLEEDRYYSRLVKVLFLCNMPPIFMQLIWLDGHKPR